MHNNIKFLVLTGGPCSGKTSLITYPRLRETLEGFGLHVLVINEGATELINAGVDPANTHLFQSTIIQQQLEREESAYTEAQQLYERTGKPVIVLCDRGLLDGAAYLHGEVPSEALSVFQDKLLDPFNLHAEGVRERYVGVVHLTTTANGAEEYYTTSNNSARRESLDEARTQDVRTQQVWLGHPHLAVIGNKNDDGGVRTFSEKCDHAIAEILRIVGIPEPLEIEDKYLLGSFDPSDLIVPYQTVAIEQTYLVSNTGSERVRTRTSLRNSSHTHTRKVRGEDGKQREHELTITPETYAQLLDCKDRERITIQKTRYHFVWECQHFELDVFHGVHEGLCLLEYEHRLDAPEAVLPPFLNIVRKVTNEGAYSNVNLAKQESTEY